jgi:phosphohistidine phosphatase
MKTWIMMRHGKSSWEIHVPDRDRPLNQRGIDDAHKMGAFLQNQACAVDAVFSSPAIRAAHTALIVSREMNLPMHKISLSESLYDFSGEDVLEFIRCLDDTVDTVMTFGHNNACTSLAYSLADFTGDNIPTAAAVLFRFDVSLWSEITKANAEYFFPKTIHKP